MRISNEILRHIEVERLAKNGYEFARETEMRLTPDQELFIARSPTWSYWYAKDVIKGYFTAGEGAIKNQAKWASRYAMEIMGDRWIEAESVIATDRYYAERYNKHFGTFL